MSKENLHLSAVQYAPVWQAAETNRQTLSDMLRDVKTDLIVLPEMFTTGFTMEAATQAEEPDGATVQWMQNLAAEKQAAVCGSLVIKDGAHYYNRLYWVLPSGEQKTYDKRHLFNYAGEGEVYQAGTERLIVEYKGWRICPLVCYDLRFPVWSRNANAYDLLLYVAHWPKKRSFHWKHLLQARAIENQSYVLGVNVVGSDANGHEYQGDTTLVAYNGAKIQQLENHSGILQAELDPTAQSQYRQQLPFLKDGDSFEIK